MLKRIARTTTINAAITPNNSKYTFHANIQIATSLSVCMGMRYVMLFIKFNSYALRWCESS